MENPLFIGQNFNIKDTLECGQTFRFYPFKDGYFVMSGALCCYTVQTEQGVEIYSDNPGYFYNYFDGARDYTQIVEKTKAFGIDFLSAAADYGKGIRILKQDAYETLFSFLISQNNNIARIKGIIERLCTSLGEKKCFMGEWYYTFPSAAALASKDALFYRQSGLGYRAEYLYLAAQAAASGGAAELDSLPTNELKRRLVQFKGIGEKVADCILLFGYSRTDSFPVDVWIYKLYRDNFGGSQTDRGKVTKYFTDMFGDISGFVQQYLFYFKRTGLLG